MRNDLLNESNGKRRRRMKKRRNRNKSAPNRFRCCCWCCCCVLMFSLALFQSNWIRVVFIKLRLVWFVPRAHSLTYNIFVVTCTVYTCTQHFFAPPSHLHLPSSPFQLVYSVFMISSRFHDFIIIIVTVSFFEIDQRKKTETILILKSTKSRMNIQQCILCMCERSCAHCSVKLSVASVWRKRNWASLCCHLNGF